MTFHKVSILFCIIMNLGCIDHTISPDENRPRKFKTLEFGPKVSSFIPNFRKVYKDSKIPLQIAAKWKIISVQAFVKTENLSLIPISNYTGFVYRLRKNGNRINGAELQSDLEEWKDEKFGFNLRERCFCIGIKDRLTSFHLDDINKQDFLIVKSDRNFYRGSSPALSKRKEESYFPFSSEGANTMIENIEELKKGNSKLILRYFVDRGSEDNHCLVPIEVLCEFEKIDKILTYRFR